MLNYHSSFAIADNFQRYIHLDKSIVLHKGKIKDMIEYINTHKWLDHNNSNACLRWRGIGLLTQRKGKR